jgi:hypothetical protein
MLGTISGPSVTVYCKVLPNGDVICLGSDRREFTFQGELTEKVAEVIDLVYGPNVGVMTEWIAAEDGR